MASVSDMYSDDYILEEFYEEKIKVKKEKTKKRKRGSSKTGEGSCSKTGSYRSYDTGNHYGQEFC